MISSLSELRTSISLEALVIGFLILALLIPVAMIREVIGDREVVGMEAERDIAQSWGGEQVIGGPILLLPYEAVDVTDYRGRARRTRYAVFLPETLTVDVDLDSEMRHRGLLWCGLGLIMYLTRRTDWYAVGRR